MLAYRTTYMIKQGQMQKALELLTNESKRSKLARPPVRIYTPSVSPNVLVLEMDSETEDAYDAFWAEYHQDPDAEPFNRAWAEVVEQTLGTDRWNVTELEGEEWHRKGRRPEMYAYRKAHIIKQGQMHKALELLTNEVKRITLARPPGRIYTPSISPNVLVLEMDSETEEAYDAFWAAYSKDEGAAPFWKEWNKILERKLSDERWKVTEL